MSKMHLKLNVNGKAEGLLRVWHENGQLWMEGNYVNGKKNGLHREWHENGRLLSEKNYVNGELVD